MKILVVNAGSSTHKLSLFDIQSNKPEKPLWKGFLDWGRNQVGCTLCAQTKDGKKVEQTYKSLDLHQNLKILIETMWKGETQVIETPSAIDKVGHRVVHGGRYFQEPILLTAQVKEEIRQLIPLAPLHNPANLEGIEILEKIFPSIPQFAVFDTAFHAHMPEVTKAYPLPYVWKEEGIQRYGFHGISHQYCSEHIVRLMEKKDQLRIINCHLGNGSSLCAIRSGVSINTTMGFTPLEGLMMGSRCGSIDPSILLYCLREKNLSVDELDHILNFQSGLKGISGFSDMREVEERKNKDEKAALALSMYVYRLKFFIGALATCLEGLDVLSFTGGIGENSATVRRMTCQGLQFLGIDLEENKNEACQPDQDIASLQSRVHILIIHTQEEWMIAKQINSLDAYSPIKLLD